MLPQCTECSLAPQSDSTVLAPPLLGFFGFFLGLLPLKLNLCLDIPDPREHNLVAGQDAGVQVAVRSLKHYSLPPARPNPKPQGRNLGGCTSPHPWSFGRRECPFPSSCPRQTRSREPPFRTSFHTCFWRPNIPSPTCISAMDQLQTTPIPNPQSRPARAP